MTLLTTQSGITLQSVEARPSDVGRPCVLCVHGMFGGAWQFEGWLRLLAERGYAAYAMNLRGHHDSRPVVDLGRVSVLDFVKDALAVAKGLGAPAVLGHSMGGLIAQKLAESDAVCAAVLLSSTPPRGIPVTSPMLIGRQLKYLPQMLFSRPINPDRKDADRLLFNRTPPAEADAIFERLVAESGTAARELSLGAVAIDARRVRCPVLSVSANEDRLVPPRIGRALVKKYLAEPLVVDGHAHLVIIEAGWENVAARVLDWLDRVVGKTARVKA